MVPQTLKKALGKLTPDNMASCSKLPAIMAVNPYESANDALTIAINAQSPSYKRKEINDNYGPMYWGNVNEEIILKTTLKILNIKGNTEVKEPFIHPTLKLAGSADGIGYGSGAVIEEDSENGIYIIGSEAVKLEGPGIIEAKNTKASPKDKPELYRGPLQVQGLMMCSGYKWGAVATLYQGSEYRLYLYNIDEKVQDEITKSVLLFQEKIDLYNRDGVTDYYNVANPFDGANIYRLDEGLDSVTLQGQDMQMIDKYMDACSLIKSGTIIKDECTRYFMDIMGNHEFAKGNNVEVQWKMNKPRKGYTVPDSPARRARSIKVKFYDKEV